jgi:hypothetical protein
MPGNIGSAVMKRPHDLPRCATMTCGCGDLAVRHDGASRDSANDIAEIFQLHFAPVISASLAKKLVLRSVLMPQFTGGD